MGVCIRFGRGKKAKEFEDVANEICICYNVYGQKDWNVHEAHKERTPESIATTFGGSSSFTEKLTVWAWLPSIHLHQTT